MKNKTSRIFKFIGNGTNESNASFTINKSYSPIQIGELFLVVKSDHGIAKTALRKYFEELT